MRGRIASAFGNAMLAIGSLAATLAMVELVVFGALLKPDDVLPNVTINGIVRYLPGTEATFRHPGGAQSHVTINSDGWNSTKPVYRQDRAPGRRRIAVVGDSYVHASFVDTKDAYPEVVEQELNRRGLDAEVYRFGMDGAPLSQYLAMLRSEVLRYQPDLVVVGLIHNDFDESYRGLRSRTSSSFMKVEIENGRPPREIPPDEYRPGFADLLRNFATFRYLYYETNLYLTARSFVSRLVWGGDEDYLPEHISSAVDVRRIADHDRNLAVTRYVLEEMVQLSRLHRFELVVAMDGVREAVYDGSDPEATDVGILNRIAAGVCDELGVPFVDLHKSFAADWAIHRERFEFPYDWHWNVRGNRIVGEAIADVAARLLRAPSARQVSGRRGLPGPDG